MKIQLVTTNKMNSMKGHNVGGVYSEYTNSIFVAKAGSADDVVFAHELAHAFSARRNSQGQEKVNLFPGYALLNANDWAYGVFFGKYDYFARTWTPDGEGWTPYARGEGTYGPALPYEDFAETAAHTVLHDSKVILGSTRYKYMLALMPGLWQK